MRACAEHNRVPAVYGSLVCVAETFDQSVTVRPVTANLDPQTQKYFLTKQFLQHDTRLAADLFEYAALLTNGDLFLALPLYPDNSADCQQAFLTFEFFNLYR
jgi:hypothetical protein